MNEKNCKVLAAQIRLETLKVIHSRGFGHVGGSMDLADLMAVLYGEVMKFDPKNPRWEDRDWMVLSKGHAGPVAYATYGIMGYYPMEDAYTLNHPHTKFPSHTDRKLTPGVDLTTGSLGQGVSTAVGAALGNKIDGRTNHVFCVVGDGEADEGQVWEGFHFAYAHKLDNIIFFIDKNGYQLDGPTDTILAHGDLAKKAEAFIARVNSLERDLHIDQKLPLPSFGEEAASSLAHEAAKEANPLYHVPKILSEEELALILKSAVTSV